ncbi:MAG: response regulator [Verrucomicrobiota bacterium]
MSLFKRFFIPGQEKVHEVPDDDIPPSRRKLLMLDDDKSLTNILKEVLATHNYDVTVVSGGAEGIKHVMAADFDVILCDMVMPGFPGDMFYRAVERTKPHLCKRFIFMTGHRGDTKIDEFIRSVKGLMLWKPFEIPQLMDAIRVIEKKAGQPATVA